MKWILVLLMLLAAVPARAQLSYQDNAPAPAPAPVTKDVAERVKRTRANETALRPDWYGLFIIWAKQNPSIVLSGLQDPAAFDNFASFIACDWKREFGNNDITWPQKQIAIIQKFNERAVSPPVKFRLITYALLGQYMLEQQQFDFYPLKGAAFRIQYPVGRAFGIEDDCDASARPAVPWPAEFIIGFKNADFITALPMEKLRAEYFLNDLPKNGKGDPDRRVTVEVEFEVREFEVPDVSIARRDMVSPVKTWLHARRAIVYADSKRTQELGRFGFSDK